MAVKSSGSLAMTDIVNEFGGSAPHSLNEYYGVASGVPTSGTIAFDDFYGASAVISLAYPSGNHQKVNLESWVTSLGHSVPNNFAITILYDTTFWSNDIGVPALTTGNLGNLILYNNGIIMGKGGDAVQYNIPDGFRKETGSNWGFTKTAAGWRSNIVTPAQNGGPALSVNCTATINNSGYIAGGGAGGVTAISGAGDVFNPGGQYEFWDATLAPIDVYGQFNSSTPMNDNLFGNFCNYDSATRTFLNNGFSPGATIKVPPIYGWGKGGGAGGGRGGRSILAEHRIIGEDIPYSATPLPPAITGINQTGTQAFRQLGSDSVYLVNDAGNAATNAATPSDGGGAGSAVHWSSQTSLGGGENY